MELCFNMIIGFGLILNLLCWKFRFLSSLIIHYELIYQCGLTLVPLYADGNQDSLLRFLQVGYVFAFTSTNIRVDIVACTIAIGLMEGLLKPLIWHDDRTDQVKAVTIISVVCCFILTSVIAICITFVASLNARTTKLIAENSKIFDKMHEGVIIVSRDDLNP